MMEYISTRGGSQPVSFETTLFQSYAPDGGFFVPKSVPVLDWSSWRNHSYKDIVTELLKSFSNINPDIIAELVERGFASGFQLEEHARVVNLEEGLNILELFHGPTWAFKDYALKVIGELQQWYLQQRSLHQIAVVATSGDTGSAAIEAVRGKPNIDIVVLYPHNRVTNVQKKQLTSCSEKNVHVICADGSSDELDVALRCLLCDQDYSRSRHLASYNSVQWARILIQMAHWIYAYFRVTRSDDEQVTMAVPCGGCGNLAVKLLACCGKNDSVYRCIRNGKMVMGEVSPSLANAIDIQVPYNLERILYVLSDGDYELIKSLMDTYEETGAVDLPDQLARKTSKMFETHLADDEEIKASIRWCHEKFGYFLCPHTATTVSFAKQNAKARPLICIATASAEKFPEVFRLAGLAPPPLTWRQKQLDNASACDTTFYSSDSKEFWPMNLRVMIDDIAKARSVVC